MLHLSATRSRCLGRTALALVVASALSATAGASPFGINVHTADAEGLEAAAAAGIDWIRIDLIWAIVEPAQDQFDWGLYDRIVNDARGRGLRILASIAYTPAWATDGGELTGVPRDPADWYDVCYRAAARYRGRIDAWGLWNEPNLGGFWQGSRQQYIEQILIPGARAVRAADPSALVTGPDLAHLNGASWDSWLDACIRQAGDLLDVVTHHVYPSGESQTDVTRKLQNGSVNPLDPPSVRKVLERTGWFGRPFWVTETGYPSSRGGEYKQSFFYRDLIDDWFGLKRVDDWVGRIFFYQLHDDPRSPDMTWGIMGPPPGLVPKQAYHGYREVAGRAVVDDAEVVSAEPPRFLTPLTEAGFTVTLRNTGSTIWTAAAGYRLEANVDDCHMVLDGGALDPVWPVPPGGTTAVRVRVRSSLWIPARPPHQCTLGWRMVAGDGSSFGDELHHHVAITADAPPVILAQPGHWSGPVGSRLVLGVHAASAAELSYQWQRNGLDLEDDARLSGSASSLLTISGIEPGDAGDYRCVVTTLAGSVISDRAEIRVTASGTGEPRAGTEQRPSAANITVETPLRAIPRPSGARLRR